MTVAAALSAAILNVLASQARAQQSSTPLDTITVRGEATDQAGDGAPSVAESAEERPWEPVDGFVATVSASATKTGTPLIETPQSISIVTADQIEAQRANSLTEALRYTPGVSAEHFGFEPRLTFLKIRGFDADTQGLFKDGLQLRNPGFAISYALEPYGAERIEVPKGPASVLYGAGAPGGLVNYVSKRPTGTTFREVELDVGRHDHVQGKFDLGGRVDAAGRLSYRMTGLVRDSDTQVDFIQDDRIFLAPAVTWRPGDRTTLTILAHYQDDETKSSQAYPGPGTLTGNPNGRLSTSLFTGEPAVDRYERSEYSITSLFEHVASPIWTLRQNARYLSSDLDDVSIFGDGRFIGAALQPDLRTLDRSLFGNFGELRSFAVDTQAEAKFRTGKLEHTLLLGLDYQHVDVRSRQSFSGPVPSGVTPPLDVFAPVYGAPVPVAAAPLITDTDATETQTGLYAQNQIRFNRKWILSLGGRHDWASSELSDFLADTKTDQDDEAFTGRVGLVFKSDMGLAPYAGYAESFLPVSGTDSGGNAFEPETGQQYEIGVKYQPPGRKSFITAAYFDLTRQNFTETDPATFFSVQTGEARSRGVEVSAVASLASGLDLIASFTHFDLEITESANPAEIGATPGQTPETTASLWADYTVQSGPLQGFGVGAGVRYIGPTFVDVPNTIEAPSVTLADAALSYERGALKLALNVQNLFDEEYIASCFVRGGTFCTYGTTRNVVGSVKVRW